MNQEEFLLAEHRELVELYVHYLTSENFMTVNIVIVNGVLGSLLLVLVSIKFPLELKLVAWIPCVLGLLANILAYFYFSRKNIEISSVLSKTLIIERTLQSKDVAMDTFQNCVVAIDDGKVLSNSRDTFRSIRWYQRMRMFEIVKCVILAMSAVWLAGLILSFLVL